MVHLGLVVHFVSRFTCYLDKIFPSPSVQLQALQNFPIQLHMWPICGTDIIKIAFCFDHMFFIGSLTDCYKSNILVCPEQPCRAHLLRRAGPFVLVKAKLKGHTSKCKGFLTITMVYSEELNCAKVTILQEYFPF